MTQVPGTYVPRAFREEDLAAQHDLIEANSFGQLAQATREIVSGPDALGISHLPFRLDRARGVAGHLRCHVAKANPIWRTIEQARVLAVFSGPHAYISPDWYASPDMVPTWNYTAAYVHGRARLMEDSELDQLLRDLTDTEEARITDKAPWSVDKVAPEVYASMRPTIVGIDIAITTIDGKSKMSQNRLAADRAGAMAGLRGLGSPDALAVAALIEGASG